MVKGGYELDERAYSTGHIAKVLVDLRGSFPRYYQEMNRIRGAAAARFQGAIHDFLVEQERYADFLDRDALEEFEYDPGSFKAALQRDCPIVRRCLNSPAKVMDAYRRAFYDKQGQEMLNVSTNIVEFAHGYMAEFDEHTYAILTAPDATGLAEVDVEECTSNGVIGGGIRSHFLYQLYPQVFPNRSQRAIWALYFLSEKKDYGLTDGSEFLMIEETGAQQNYFYPYDLFGLYALNIYRLIEAELTAEGHPPNAAFRYVYVDAFFNHVGEIHEDDINIIRPEHQRFDY